MNGSDDAQTNFISLHYVYILICRDGTLYTGYTPDLGRRLKTHNSGHGAKYTRNRLPVYLVYHEPYLSRKEAMSREYAIKQLTRAQKLDLIVEHHYALITQGTVFDKK